MRTSLSAASLTAVRGAVVRPFFATELLYPQGPVRMSTLDVPMQLQSPSGAGLQEFVGGGALGAMSGLQEGPENRSYGFQLTLSGIPLSFASYLRGQDPQGGLCSVMLGFVGANRDLLAIETIAVGRMDSQDIQIGETLAIVVNCESIQVDWERARVRRCTDADHRARHPADGFFKYVSALENMELQWGRA